MTFYRTDGRALKALDLDAVMGPGWADSYAAGSTVAPREFFKVVPFVRRAARLRANAVASVPITLQKGGTDLSERAEWQGLMGNLATRLYEIELTLCLSMQGAYWRKTTNRLGANPTPEWLLPQNVWPVLLAETGLAYFRYIHPWGAPQSGAVENLQPDEVVRFWYPNLDRVNWPGPPPGLAALAAAGVLANEDAFVAQYFGRGAIKATLLTVPSATNQLERDKLKTWWDRMITGVQNAWRSIVVSADVKPVVIGEGLADLSSEKLVLQYRQDVAAAFEVPETMLMQGAANYATAQAERISFFEETVFPELGLILGAINDQWLRPDYGVELVAHPEQTEASQDAQVAQAAAVTDLVGGPVLTVDEGRAWLGLGPMPAGEQVDDAGEDDDFRQMDDEAAADDAAEDDAEVSANGDEAKRFVHGADGRYGALPGTGTRKAERAALLAAHAQVRAETRARHRTEKADVRARGVQARLDAKDARSRLRLVHEQRGQVAMLGGRHKAERMVLRTLQAAERGRMRDRHAAQRQVEIATWQEGA